MNYKFIYLALCISLSSCGNDDKPQAEKTSIEKAHSMQLESLEKAKGIEQQLQKNLDKRNQQIDQGGG